MADDGKFYWLKLKRDFFKRHDIRIIEAMPNGTEYLLFYLKLLVESVDHNGNLRFSDEIPYNDEMLAVVTDSSVAIVKNAMNVLSNAGLVSVKNDGTIVVRKKPESSRDRQSSKYRNWRNSVFERDNYTCAMCGMRGGRLNAHHIKSWVSTPDLRYDVENGVTLCTSCHIKHHREERTARKWQQANATTG